MLSRIPRWVKAVGLSLGALLIVVAAVIPSDRFKNWFTSQMANPRGPMGWVFAHWLNYLGLNVYDTWAKAAEMLRLQPDDELLHVGCEAGALLDAYAGHVRRIAGLDMSEMRVGMAKKRLADRIAAGTADIVHGDPGDLPWDDNTFTAATCPDGTMLDFPDTEAALAEMYRVLRPGGRILVNIGIDETDEACVRECDWWGIPHPPEEEARKMVEDAGFALVSISYLDRGYFARFLTGIKPE